MANPLFPNQPQNSNNPLLNMINSLRSKGPSETVFNQMYQSNPDFRQFANQVRNMTPEQAFQQNGLDFNQFRNLKW